MDKTNKNKLVIDPHGRNHFKFWPYSLENWPEDEGEQLRKIEKLYNKMVTDGVILYEKVKRGSHTIRCVELDDMYYIIICMRNEFKTYNNVIYEFKSKNDALQISKLTGKNILTLMSDYKKMMLDAKKEIENKNINIVRKEENDEERRDTSEGCTEQENQ